MSNRSLFEDERDLRLSNFLILENTKILFEGINKLYDIYQAEKELNEQLTINNFIINEYINCKNTTDIEHKFYSQNINHDFFLFIYLLVENNLNYYKRTVSPLTQTNKQTDNNRINTNEIDDICIILIIKYLKYCIDINNALYFEESRTIFYSYNSIATDICRLFNYDFCYLVYSDDLGEKILDTSDYQDSIDLDIVNSNSWIYNTIKKHKTKRCKHNNIIEETIYIPKNDSLNNYSQNTKLLIYNDNYNYLSVCIDLPNNEYECETKSIYIVLISKVDKAKLEELNRETYLSAAFVLSFKYKLQTLFKRDLSALLSLNYNNSYDDINKISSGEGLSILHLTDLHIMVNNYDEIKAKLLTKKFISNNNDSIFDLMIITGDVAQGNCGASELEENYDKALEIITIIAQKIWSDENNIIRSDWRKRILITTGNHDYASMNELYAVESNRKLKYGQVATKEGSTMVKFAYFINFIRKIQDISIGNYIDSGLNEMRKYDRMNLTICALNSCGGANPLRTNKVKLNKKWIKQVINNPEDTNYICAIHHAPEYKINYFCDRQDIKWSKLKTSDDIKNLYSALTKIGFIFGNEQNELNAIKKEHNKQMLNDLSNSLSVLKEYQEAIGTDLIDNIERYLKSNSDEYSESWRHEIVLDTRFSNEDMKEYDSEFNRLFTELKFIITLGGHEHKYEERKKYKAFAGEKFYKNGEIHYGVVSLFNYNKDSKKYENVEYYNK